VSRFVSELAIAYTRWKGEATSTVPPRVGVLRTSGESKCFNGITVLPSLETFDAAVIASGGNNADTWVVRDRDIFSVEIQSVQ